MHHALPKQIAVPLLLALIFAAGCVQQRPAEAVTAPALPLPELQIAIDARLIYNFDPIAWAGVQPSSAPAADPTKKNPLAYSGSLTFRRLNELQLFSLLRTIQDTRTTETVTAPRTTLFNGRPGAVTIPHLRNYSVTMQGSTQPYTPRPEPPHLGCGTTIYFQAETPSEESKRVTLTLRDLIPPPVAPPSAATAATTLRPYARGSLPASMVLRDGEVLLVSGFTVTDASDPAHPRTRPLLLLLKPKVIPSLPREEVYQTFGMIFDPPSSQPAAK